MAVSEILLLTDLMNEDPLQVPVVMGFAVPDRTREVRMEAAYFLQQLCQSRYFNYFMSR